MTTSRAKAAAEQIAEQALGAPAEALEWEPITPTELGELLWQLEDVFRPYFRIISACPYLPKSERAADDAALNLADAPRPETLFMLAAPTLRVLFERHRQMLTVAGLNSATGSESIMRMPVNAEPHLRLQIAIAFWLCEMTLPMPVSDQSQIEPPPDPRGSSSIRH
ncbi:hypothetical protein C27AD_10026 [Salinisphaera hydrothermalis C27AD]